MYEELSDFADALMTAKLRKKRKNEHEISHAGSPSGGLYHNDIFPLESDTSYDITMSSTNIAPFPSLSWAPNDLASSYADLDAGTMTMGDKHVGITNPNLLEQLQNFYDSDVEIFHVKKISKSDVSTGSSNRHKARGKYKCSMCGAQKGKHVCTLLPLNLQVRTIGTQCLPSNNRMALVLPANVKGLWTEPMSSSAAIAMKFRGRFVTVSRGRTTIQGPASQLTTGEQGNGDNTQIIRAEEDSNESESAHGLQRTDAEDVDEVGGFVQRVTADNAQTDIASASTAHTLMHPTSVFQPSVARPPPFFVDHHHLSQNQQALVEANVKAKVKAPFKLPVRAHVKAPVQVPFRFVPPSALGFLGKVTWT